jgi:hypothetical protein
MPTHQQIKNRQQYATLHRKAVTFNPSVEYIPQEEKFDVNRRLFYNLKICTFNETFYLLIFLHGISLHTLKLPHNKECLAEYEHDLLQPMTQYLLLIICQSLSQNIVLSKFLIALFAFGSRSRTLTPTRYF